MPSLAMKMRIGTLLLSVWHFEASKTSKASKASKALKTSNDFDDIDDFDVLLGYGVRKLVCAMQVRCGLLLMVSWGPPSLFYFNQHNCNIVITTSQVRLMN